MLDSEMLDTCMQLLGVCTGCLISLTLIAVFAFISYVIDLSSKDEERKKKDLIRAVKNSIEDDKKNA